MIQLKKLLINCKILFINLIILELAIKANSSLDDEFVIGIYIKDYGAYAFPTYIMDHHEIVNVDFNSTSISITWSPHTSTNRVFNMTKELRPKTLGISKYFYQNNLVVYDRATFTFWSQIKGLGLSGPLMGNRLEIIDSMFTRWKTWKNLHPSTLVLDKPSKQLKKYYEDRYVNYRKQRKPRHHSCYADNDKEFPFYLKHSKEITFVIELDTSHFLIPISETKLLMESSYNGSHFLFIFHEDAFYFKAFNRNFEGNVLNFRLVEKDDPIRKELILNNSLPIFKDASDSIWDSFGHCIYGTHKGKSLNEFVSNQMFWFSATSFFSTSPIWYNGSIVRNDDESFCKEEVKKKDCVVDCENIISRWISHDVLQPVDDPVFITAEEFEEEGLIPWDIIMAYIIIISILIALFFSLLIHYFITKRKKSETIMSAYDSDDMGPPDSSLEKKVTFDLENSEVIQLSRTSNSNDVVMVDMSQNNQTTTSSSEEVSRTSSKSEEEEEEVEKEDEANEEEQALDLEEEEEDDENGEEKAVDVEEEEEDDEGELAKILSPEALKHIKDGLNRT